MNCLLWSILRFSLCAWVGAASLFVVTGVREVTLTDFDAATKNLLAATRFPAYYAFGFTLVAVSAIAGFALILLERQSRRRNTAMLSLVVLALIVMYVDHRFIYEPLEAMMLEPEGRLRPEFWTYHQWSKYINCVSVGACMVAALISVWPRRAPTLTDSPQQS
jgi:hypothetical protein